MTYNPFEDCEDCAAFNPADPYEENDVDPFVACEEDTITDPYRNCSESSDGILSFSSRPYPMHAQDAMNIFMSLLSGRFLSQAYNAPIESLSLSGSTIISGRYKNSLYICPIENISITGNMLSGRFKSILYDDWPVEELDITATIQSGRIPSILYDDYPTEKMTTTATMQSGELR